MAKQNIIFVTSYPEKGEIHSSTTVGVASYAKQLAIAMCKQDQELEIKILAESLPNVSVAYVDEGIKVERRWIRGSVVSLLSLLKEVWRSKQKTILVSLEINMFGGVGQTALMLIGLALLRIFGKRVILIAHQVPARFTDERRLFKTIWHLGISIYYLLIKIASSGIVVFEQYLADILNDRKVWVIPHALPVVKGLSRDEARAILGWDKNKLYALCFGYIAPYKGIMRLIKNWKERNIKLVIAGGINPNHVNNQKIKDYVVQVKEMAKTKKVEVTGFVEEDKLELYFGAVDEVLFPYEMMFSSSGPLAWAIAYQKPILLSQEMKAYLLSKDFGIAIDKAGIKESDVLVDFDRDFNFAVEQAVQNKSKWQEFGKEMKKSRNWQVVGAKFLEVIHEE